MTNTLCNGLVKNNNTKSPIAYFNVVTVREFSDYSGGSYIDQINSAEEFLDFDDEAVAEPFYQIYGQRYIDDATSKTIFLGNFYSIDDVRNFLYNLTGENPDIISYDKT